MTVWDVIKLSDLLGELGQIKRATRLPNDEQESDTHHSFSLALIAYAFCTQECPELDIDKVVLYALTHELLEVVTGDEDTLHYDVPDFAAKHAREREALKHFDKLFADYPMLKDAMYEYDRLDTAEAATVFVLDKACTTWTHMHDGAEHARKERNLPNRQSVADWASRQRGKINHRLKAQPPDAVMELYEASFRALADQYDK